MSMRALAVLVSCLCISACGTLRVPAADSGVAPAAMQGDAARPANATQWIRSELYFGVGSEDGNATRVQEQAVSEQQWRDFLDREVTPRFPDGLTVFDGYGQWRFHDATTPNRLKTKVLVILHEDTPQRRADIEAIRSAWKNMTLHESVLWSQEKVDVSF